jgi:SagB-type dehydrogenase family enzyme
MNLIGVLPLALAMSFTATAMENEQRIPLPTAGPDQEMSVGEALEQRRSIREFSRDGLILEDVSQLLWAAQGITGRRGFRTAPSAGALYPLELYIVTGDVAGLAPGVYRYRPKKHDLVLVATGDLRKPLASAALGQTWVRRAPMVLVIAGVYERTMTKYGQRGRRYVHMEVGHAAQNIYLQATANGLGTVMVGAFHDKEVQEVLSLPVDHEPLGLMPVGHTR